MSCSRFRDDRTSSVAVIYQGPPFEKRFGDITTMDILGASSHLETVVESWTGLKWKVIRDRAELPPGQPVIALGTPGVNLDWTGPFAERLKDGKGVTGAEGYRIEVDAEHPGVVILGNDERGVVFGIGRLVRELRMSAGRVLLPADFHIATAPKVKLRGHQLGYRPKTNSYDGWDRTQWYRYIRDLSLFGTNAIELLPPRTDDDADSPHFPLPPLKMMTEMSRLADDFETLDVWVWFPALNADYVDPAKVETALKEWETAFKALPRLDAVFVPGGDPGHTRPKVLLTFLEKVTALLHESHPKAQMWVSPQGFNAEWMDEFLGELKSEPPWLTGVVFGPQVRMNLPELRKAVPAHFPIRGYPDITHSRQCQHPVPNWDLAFAATEGREPINPRPRAEAAIAKEYQIDTIGFITYSEGCNDDVNKIIWSALGWDPEADVAEILRQYARVFLDDRHAEGFAQALFDLEQNWNGPLLTNAAVESTLKQLQEMERTADPKLRHNWRFQQALYRGHYDAYLRDRLIHETALESEALAWLRKAKTIGSDLAMTRATAVLERALTEPVSLDRRARVFELGEALFQSIQMQLSVPRYQAIAAERGANLDAIDAPLNNRKWLMNQFGTIESLKSEADKLRAPRSGSSTATIPLPGGFYDELGNPSNRPHLVFDPLPEKDPLLIRAPFVGFALVNTWPTAWHSATLIPLSTHRSGSPTRASTRRVATRSASPTRATTSTPGCASKPTTSWCTTTSPNRIPSARVQDSTTSPPTPPPTARLRKLTFTKRPQAAAGARARGCQGRRGSG